MATSKQNINSENKRLLSVSRKLTKGDLEEMIWLCEGKIADGELESIASVLALFRKIGELDETGNKGIAFIAELLEEIGKPNLHNELLGIESNKNDSAEKLKPQINVKIRRKVEDMLAGEWKRFARYLHIEDHIIDQIDVDNKRVADACHESLKQWMKVEGAEATVEKLKEVLSAMPRMDVFNAIEELEGKTNDAVAAKAASQTAVLCRVAPRPATSPSVQKKVMLNKMKKIPSAQTLVLKEIKDRFRMKAPNAKKDCIKLDKVPSGCALDSGRRVTPPKATPAQSRSTSSFARFFPSLVPVPSNQAMASHDKENSRRIKDEVGRLKESTRELIGILASLNLPAAIEDLSGVKVPKSVLEKSAAVEEMGGVAILDQMMQDLPELLTRNREIIDETIIMMGEEEHEDTEMKERFQNWWNRMPSKQLTEQLRAEGGKFLAVLNDAMKVDAIVKSKYNENRRVMNLLCKSEQEIEAALPKGGYNVEAGQGAVHELRKLMVEVDEMKKERENLEEHVKATSMNMASKFLQVLPAECFSDCEDPNNQGLDGCNGEYQKLSKKVNESLEKQEALLAKIQDANNRFIAEKRSSGAANQRAQVLQELVQAYDTFNELVASLKEGSKFYNNLTDVVRKFQSTVNDLVFARRIEKDSLSQDIENEIARHRLQPAPAVPAHIRVPLIPSAPSQRPPKQKFQSTQQLKSASPNAWKPPYPMRCQVPQSRVYAPAGAVEIHITTSYVTSHDRNKPPQYEAPGKLYGEQNGQWKPPDACAGFQWPQQLPRKR